MSLIGEFMADESATRRDCALSKPQLQAAFDAAEAWLTSNKVAYNLALPQPARGILTAKQKTRLLYLVVRNYWETTS